MNKEQSIKYIEDFLASNKKGILVKGNQQFEKHKLVMALVNKHYNKSKILFRINAMQNIENNEFLGWTKKVKKNPKSGEQMKIGNNFYEFDSFNSCTTWNNTDMNFKCAIVYPIDAIIRENKLEALENLYNHKNIDKVFLISWYDREDYDFLKLKEYYDCEISYDEEED